MAPSPVVPAIPPSSDVAEHGAAIAEREEEDRHVELADLMGATADPCGLSRQIDPEARSVDGRTFLEHNVLAVQRESDLFPEESGGGDAPQRHHCVERPEEFLRDPEVRRFLDGLFHQGLDLLRQELSDAVARLKERFHAFESQSPAFRKHYPKLWERLLERVAEIRTAWADQLVGDLEAIEPSSA